MLVFRANQKEKDVVRLARRYLKKEITSTQYRWWLNQWGISYKEALSIFKCGLIRELIILTFKCSAILFFVWIVCSLAVKFAGK